MTSPREGDARAAARRSGILVPLFSLVSTRSWGVGEFADLLPFARWLQSAGQSFVQILPITEIPDEQSSPYSALTAMALDPIHLSLPAIEDFDALGGISRLDAPDRALLDEVREAPRIDHRGVRRLKARWLRQAADRFAADERPRGSARAARYEEFVRAESWWLDDYALFRALRRRHPNVPWWEWPRALKRREASALDRARAALRDEIEYHRYVQWMAAEQWADARARARPVQVFGDLPFMIGADSPDVWTDQEQFRFDGTVGVPPDAFSPTGQDWGLPPWRWEVMARDDFDWMRRRARRTAALFDGFRLDHLVGLYRTYIRPLDPDVEAFFTPPDEPSQLRLGEHLVRLYQSSGAEIVAEDLGTVPDFVRASLARLEVPGFKVLRWERRWDTPGQPFIDPADYPAASVATTGTHDTEPLVVWWNELSPAERRLVLAMPTLARLAADSAGPSADPAAGRFSLALADVLLRALLAAPSRLTIIPIQDVFGWPDRINTPATVDESNWTWRLPWAVDELDTIPDARERASALAAWTRAAGRK